MTPKVGVDDFVAATRASAADLNALPRERLQRGRSPLDGGPSQAEELIQLATDAGCELFHTPDGDVAYAVIPNRDHLETWPVRSKSFKRWLSRLRYDKLRKPANSQPLADAVNALEGLAQFEGREADVFVRVAAHQEAIYLDLADPAWRAIEITADGWRVVAEPPVRLRRPRGMLALPAPEPGGQLAELRTFVNLPAEEEWRLVVAWLLAALRPTGPYPILVLHGEQGTGKSTLARVLRRLVDPNTADLRGDPRETRDLMIAASNGWVLAFDNLSRISPWLSDAFCRLATGGGFATRELYSDTDETLIDAQRPVLINGIEELVTRGDLLDRALITYLKPIADADRRSEREFWAAFDRARPRLLGALLDAVVAAHRRLPEVRLEGRPRLADFAEWVAAAEPALGWVPGSFLAVYQGNRAAGTDLALDVSPVAVVMRDLAERGPWTGTATELLDRLTALAGERMTKQPAWPRSPRALSNALRRLAPNLRAVGISVAFDHREAGTGRRLIAVEIGGAANRHDRHAANPGAGSGRDDAQAGMTDVLDRPPQFTPVSEAGRDGCDDAVRRRSDPTRERLRL